MRIRKRVATHQRSCRVCGLSPLMATSTTSGRSGVSGGETYTTPPNPRHRRCLKIGPNEKAERSVPCAYAGFTVYRNRVLLPRINRSYGVRMRGVAKADNARIMQSDNDLRPFDPSAQSRFGTLRSEVQILLPRPLADRSTKPLDPVKWQRLLRHLGLATEEFIDLSVDLL